MSKKKERVYVVRGFNSLNEAFSNPTGVIEDKSSFIELTVGEQHQAVTALLANPVISTMSVSSMVSRQNDIAVNGLYQTGACDEGQMVQVIDFKLCLNSTDKHEIRSLKTTLREVFKRWAEKSRAKGRRGFRANAIKTPVFEYLGTETVMRVQVILSNAIIYSDKLVDVSPQCYNTVTQDLAQLGRELTKRLGAHYNGLHYTHSLIGSGEVW